MANIIDTLNETFSGATVTGFKHSGNCLTINILTGVDGETQEKHSVTVENITLEDISSN